MLLVVVTGVLLGSRMGIAFPRVRATCASLAIGPPPRRGGVGVVPGAAFIAGPPAGPVGRPRSVSGSGPLHPAVVPGVLRGAVRSLRAHRAASLPPKGIA
jgi:hypothetical protein